MKVDTRRSQFAFLVDELGNPLSIQTFILQREQSPYRITFQRGTFGHHQVENAGGRLQIGNLVMIISERKVRSPREILALNILRVERKFHTPRFHVGIIGIFPFLASHATGTYQTDKVESPATVNIRTQTDAIAQHPEIETKVELILFLPRQILILQRLDINLRFFISVIAAVSSRVTEYSQSVVCRSHCSCQSVCGTQREGRNHILMFHKFFFQHIPRTRHVPRRQPTGITRTPQAVGTIHTPRQVECVTSFIRKTSGSKECYKTVIIL